MEFATTALGRVVEVAVQVEQVAHGNLRDWAAFTATAVELCQVSSARLADALGWSLDRLGDALAALDTQLDDTGLRIDHDPAATSPAPVRGLRPGPAPHRHPTRRAAPAPHDPEPGLDVESARLLYAIAHDPRAITERHLAYDPAAVVALQQRGLVRRHPGGGYLELTEDAHYSLAAEPAPPAP